MHLKAKEKKERALGTKLFLKAYRSHSPKSAMLRRPNRPGVHGARPVRGGGSEYKTQLMEKQKIRFTYGLSEHQMKSVVHGALKAGSGSVPERIIKTLESRLDNVVFRVGFSPSRIMARQSVSHGHITVNGRKVTIPSYRVRVGDVIGIRESRKNILLFKDLPNTLKAHSEPAWLLVDDMAVSGKVKAEPLGVELPFNINLVIDFYSR